MSENLEVLIKVLIKKVNTLENQNKDAAELVKLLRENNKTLFFRFDPTEYIKQPLENFTKVYKYKGNLYDNIATLHRVLERDARINITLKTLQNTHHQRDVEFWWGCEVNIVYLAKLNFNNKRTYYVSTDGKFYSGDLQEISSFGPYSNAVRIMDDGEYVVMYAGEYVMFKFIDPDYEGSKVFFKDGDYSNCRIDNLDKMT